MGRIRHKPRNRTKGVGRNYAAKGDKTRALSLKLAQRPAGKPKPKKRTKRHFQPFRPRFSGPYGEYLLSPHWQITRSAALSRACHRCQACGGSKQLEVHHLSYKNLGKEHPRDLKVLCRGCHKKEHKP